MVALLFFHDQLPQFGQVALQAKAQAFVFATALIGATPLSEGDLVTITKNAVAKQYRIGMRVDLEIGRASCRERVSSPV